MKKISLDTDIIKASSEVLIKESENCKKYIEAIKEVNSTIKDYYSSSNSDIFYTQTNDLLGKLVKDTSFMENYGKTLKDIETGVLDKENEYKSVYDRNRQEFGDIEGL